MVLHLIILDFGDLPPAFNGGKSKKGILLLPLPRGWMEAGGHSNYPIPDLISALDKGGAFSYGFPVTGKEEQ
jgi:hypothetical protein